MISADDAVKLAPLITPVISAGAGLLGVKLGRDRKGHYERWLRDQTLAATSALIDAINVSYRACARFSKLPAGDPRWQEALDGINDANLAVFRSDAQFQLFGDDETRRKAKAMTDTFVDLHRVVVDHANAAQDITTFAETSKAQTARDDFLKHMRKQLKKS